jgi:hypothetical protein
MEIKTWKLRYDGIRSFGPIEQRLGKYVIRTTQARVGVRTFRFVKEYERCLDVRGARKFMHVASCEVR